MNFEGKCRLSVSVLKNKTVRRTNKQTNKTKKKVKNINNNNNTQTKQTFISNEKNKYVTKQNRLRSQNKHKKKDNIKQNSKKCLFLGCMHAPAVAKNSFWVTTAAHTHLRMLLLHYA